MGNAQPETPAGAQGLEHNGLSMLERSKTWPREAAVGGTKSTLRFQQLWTVGAPMPGGAVVAVLLPEIQSWLLPSPDAAQEAAEE